VAWRYFSSAVVVAIVVGLGLALSGCDHILTNREGSAGGHGGGGGCGCN
jgi:hypothetical protein